MTNELIIRRSAWENAVRETILHERRRMIGALRLETFHDRREFLVESLARHREPIGESLSESAQICVFACSSNVSATADSWLKQLAPRGAQTIVYLVLKSLPPATPELEASVWLRGQVHAMDRIRIIGGQMLDLIPGDVGSVDESDTIVTDAFGSELDEQSARIQSRWSRTIGAIGSAVHRKLRRARVTLVGTGRTGSLLAWELAALGVGSLVLIDNDRLEAANLDAMIGIGEEAIGREKVAVLGEQLIQFRSDLVVHCVPRPVTDRRAVELLRERSDLLVTCVDNDLARMAVGLVARERLVPHLDVGSSVRAMTDTSPLERPSSQRNITADARLMLPGEGCVACVGSIPDLEDVLYNLAAPEGALLRGQRRTWSEERAGSLISINSIAVGAAVQMWLDLLSGQQNTSRWQRFAWRQGEGLQSDSSQVGAADACPYCHRSWG